MLEDKITIDIIKKALEEDIQNGDITTDAILESNNDKETEARFLFKESGVVAGLPVVEKIFQTLDTNSKLSIHFSEGTFLEKGSVAATIKAKMSVLLKGERTALNFMQHLSGVATKTKEYVDAVAGTDVVILDTRKTTPNLRYLEKYAVSIGGGQNYRFGLFDMVMIKDNHIKAAGGIIKAIEKVLNKYSHKYFITVEVATLEELKQAINYPVNRIMLDNMDIDVIKKAVAIIDRKLEIEVSGGITPQRARELAPLGINYISTGAVTNRSISLDISMKFISE